MKCDKHDVELKCMAGQSAHRDNWYCPSCESPTELSKIQKLSISIESAVWNHMLAVFPYANIKTDDGEMVYDRFANLYKELSLLNGYIIDALEEDDA